MMPNRRSEGDRWLAQAERDLSDARLAQEHERFSLACFMAQQAAEKAVKAIAYGLGERVVLGHSLVTLTSRYEDRARDLGDLRELAGILDQYYVPGIVPFVVELRVTDSRSPLRGHHITPRQQPCGRAEPARPGHRPGAAYHGSPGPAGSASPPRPARSPPSVESSDHRASA